MYLHCKHGFVEADRWDGTPVPDEEQQSAALACKLAGGEVIVVRSRERDTILALLEDVRILRWVFESPPSWDYPFRAYVTAQEWATVLAGVALDLDYRNFKHWTTDHKPEQHRLAYKIWQAAYDAADSWPWPIAVDDVSHK